MIMQNKTGKIFIVIGVVLVSLALLLLLYNIREDRLAGQASDEALTSIKETIPDEIAFGVSESNLEHDGDPYEMTVKEIDGYGYIGYLDIPALDLQLPIMSEWDDDRLNIAPCREYGSSKSDDLVIAGHNYRQHFASLPKLEIGNSFIFTDMNGIINTYEVQSIEVIEPTAVEVVKNSESDIILYTCTYGGQDRVAVNGVRID